MRCLYRDKVTPKIFWFKQTLEEKPRLICVNYRSSSTFYHDLKNNPRFKLHTNNKGANLTITDLEFSDSANYYCTDQEYQELNFTEVYNVVIEGSGLTINESESESIQSGRSVTLNCKVHTGTCEGDHTVYWFKISGQSELRLVYSRNGSNNQCENKTRTCFYSLSIKNLNISQGNYYCAVVACGHIVFGNGAKLEYEGEQVTNCFTQDVYMSGLSFKFNLDEFYMHTRCLLSC